MWLFTQHGFYSTVADGTNRDYVLVRSRSEQHLKNLVQKFELDVQILHTPHADYPFRVRLKRQRWISLAGDLAADVRYTNYKSAAAKNKDMCLPRFVQLLHRVWELMYEGMQPLRDGGRRDKT